MLRARRRVEQDAQRAVAELEGRRRRLEDALRRQQAFITTSKSTLRDHLVGDVDMSSLRGHATASIQLLRQANQLLVELAGIHQRLGRARRALVEAATRRRAVELLRERRFEAWKRRIEKAEVFALDEVAAGVGRREWHP